MADFTLDLVKQSVVGSLRLKIMDVTVSKYATGGLALDSVTDLGFLPGTFENAWNSASPGVAILTYDGTTLKAWTAANVEYANGEAIPVCRMAFFGK